MNERIAEISQFFSGRRYSCHVPVEGRVCSNYRVYCRDSWGEDILFLQAIPSSKVRNPSQMATFSREVSSSLHDAITSSGSRWRLQRPLSSETGSPYISDNTGTVWRAFSEIRSSADPGISFAYGYGLAVASFRSLSSGMAVSSRSVFGCTYSLPSALTELVRLSRVSDCPSAMPLVSSAVSLAAEANSMWDSVSSSESGCVLGCCSPRSFSVDSITGECDGFRYFDCVSTAPVCMDFGDLLWRLSERGTISLPLWESACSGYLESGLSVSMPFESAFCACYCQLCRLLSDVLSGNRLYCDQNGSISRASACLSVLRDMLSRRNEIRSIFVGK